MFAPEVESAIETMTAPFCAGVEVMVGLATWPVPPPVPGPVRMGSEVAAAPPQPNRERAARKTKDAWRADLKREEVLAVVMWVSP